MICGHCAHEATAHEVPNNLTGVVEAVSDCDHCRRRFCQTTRGPRWMPRGTFCPSCKEPTWFHVEHPRFGHLIPLWPHPTSIVARYETPSGYALHGSFCAACKPRKGSRPCRHVKEAESNAGKMIGHESAGARYRFWFSDQFGAWLGPWLTDELRLDEVERDRILTAWELDRRVALRGMRHGR